MPERSAAAQRPISAPSASGDPPPPDVADFIRFCHRRRPAVWPELYDVMCGVAARREFRGWGPDQLAERGVTFALPAMPLLAAWVRATVGTHLESVEHSAPAGAGA
jgi:hypothetical protein